MYVVACRYGESSHHDAGVLAAWSEKWEAASFGTFYRRSARQSTAIAKRIGITANQWLRKWTEVGFSPWGPGA